MPTAVAEREQYRWIPMTCPLCEKRASKRLGRRGGAAHRSSLGIECAIWQCGDCGLIFPDPMPIPNSIDSHYEEPDDYFKEHVPEEKTAGYEGILSTIEALGVGPGRLLDIGAGRGEALIAAKRRGWEAVGLEPSAPFARAARANSGAEVLEAKIEERPFPEESFDAVTLGAVLEHVFNPREVLSEINRVLRKGGILWLDVPNEGGAFYVLGNLYQRLRGRDWVVNLSPTFPPYHVFGFTPRSLHKLLAVTGFKSLKFETYPAPMVLETQDAPVSGGMRAVAQALLSAGSALGAGSYMDVWASKS